MRIGFVTCVELGFSCIREIAAVGGKLDTVFTLTDDLARSKSGRVYLDDYCTAAGVPLFKIANINDASTVSVLSDAGLDWLFIIGWSQMAGDRVLRAPKSGVLGIHPTLLPKGRGRASIPWAIIKDLDETGATLFKLDEGVDTGPVAGQVRIPIAHDETASTLYEKVVEAHRALIRGAWAELREGAMTFREQNDSEATTWPGRTPADGKIERSMSRTAVERLVRATTHPYPGAYWDGDPTRGRLRIWEGGLESRTKAMELKVADGSYFAFKFDWESSKDGAA